MRIGATCHRERFAGYIRVSNIEGEEKHSRNVIYVLRSQGHCEECQPIGDGRFVASGLLTLQQAPILFRSDGDIKS